MVDQPDAGLARSGLVILSEAKNPFGLPTLGLMLELLPDRSLRLG
jgi:hypothetical protein